MATEKEKEKIAVAMGMTGTELEEVLAQNPELADAMAKSLGASLIKHDPIEYGKQVGPYGAYVANPFGALAQGVGRGVTAGMQAKGQRALLDALRNKRQGGSAEDSPQAYGATGDIDAQGDWTPGGMGNDQPMGPGLTTPPPPAKIAQPAQGPQGPRPQGMPDADAGRMPTPFGGTTSDPMAPTGPGTGAPGTRFAPAGPATMPMQGPMTNPNWGSPGDVSDMSQGPYRGQTLTGQQVYGMGTPETPEERRKRMERLMAMDMNVAP